MQILQKIFNIILLDEKAKLICHIYLISNNTESKFALLYVNLMIPDTDLHKCHFWHYSNSDKSLKNVIRKVSIYEHCCLICFSEIFHETWNPVKLIFFKISNSPFNLHKGIHNTN